MHRTKKKNTHTQPHHEHKYLKYFQNTCYPIKKIINYREKWKKSLSLYALRVQTEFSPPRFSLHRDPLSSSSQQRAWAELRTVIFHIFYGLNEGKNKCACVSFFQCVSENNRNMECDSVWEKDGNICVQNFLILFLK